MSLRERILERLGRRPMMAMQLCAELGMSPKELDVELLDLVADGTLARDGGKLHVKQTAAPAAAAADQVLVKDQPDPKANGIHQAHPQKEATTVAQKKICTGLCGQAKLLSEFYDRQSQCKRCMLDQQKASRLARTKAARGGGARSPKSPKRRPQKVSAETSAVLPPSRLAVIHTPGGVRLGPLSESRAGLIQMPYHVDLSWEQFDELAAWRKELKG